MTRLFSTIALLTSVPFIAIACGDDGDEPAPPPTGITPTTTSDASSTSSAGGMAGTGGMTSAGGMGGAGEGGMGMGGSDTAAWCASFEATCGYGMTGRYADADACQKYYDAATAGCQSCLDEHLTNAESPPPNGGTQHCPHACGEGPCAGACGTSGCQ